MFLILKSFYHFPKNSNKLEAIQYGIAAGYLIVNLEQLEKKNARKSSSLPAKNNAHRLVLAKQDVLGIVSHKCIKRISPTHIVGHIAWVDLSDS